MTRSNRLRRSQINSFPWAHRLTQRVPGAREPSAHETATTTVRRQTFVRAKVGQKLGRPPCPETAHPSSDLVFCSSRGRDLNP